MAGILDTIKLAGVLVLAIPAALAGLEFALVRGDPTTGVILLGLAAGLVVVERWITMPSDIPELVASRVVGSVVTDPESTDDESETETTDTANGR
ncbi:hypothetical protein [Natrialba sp. PRR66]|uniref:DUF7533 family protein n=1 Tax=Natrialba sp. PRR66 TaxID=3098146 RepID=UPI002B1DDA6B|nr:hypothetical protein [Natrialba sp. PRR66]